MGFMDDYGIKKEDVQEAGYRLPPIGRARFEIGDAKVQKGTKNKPGETAFVVTYQLTNADGDPIGKADERWVMKQDGKITPRAAESLGYLDMRIKTLGFPGGLSDTDFTGPDDLVGIRGTLRIEHNQQGERKFANVRDVEMTEGGADHEDDTANEYADEPAEAAAEEKPKRTRAPRTPKEPAENPVAANGDLWTED